MNRSLSGRIAVVTGASRRRGLGAAICRALASQGADILLTHWVPYDRVQSWGPDEEGPAALEAELQRLGVRAADLEIDLSLPTSAESVMDAVEQRLGTASILVNNAVHWVRAGYQDLDAAGWDRHHAVNVRAMALLSAELVLRYPGGPGGRIINITSGQGITPMPDALAYAATKGAVEAFTTSLAPAAAVKGITVNAIDPGGTDTGWMTDEVRQHLASQMAMSRVGVPEDAARLVAFLAGDDAAWITGQIIRSRGA